ncbi:Protein SET DOMAIN GROUP 41 [Cardamine amara subsp. amara]|uniref:Protein SET DOMAIN GROUP 41 n=1 Tax=Cardamine amara subsp. amara TaxID=228776 RepID=A0ABD1AIV5_CARAN
MEIIAAEDINIGTDLFPPLSPLAFSLYESFLSSHCSSCFSLLPPSPPRPPQSPTSLYCSAACSSSLTDSPIISPPDLSPILSSDIRTALRLLNSTVVTSSLPHRLNGLLTNHHRLMTDTSFSVSIKNAANFIAAVLKSNRENTELEEAAICSVLTNAVEVQDSNGRALGIALYDSRFSWINHSCSPNSCYRFSNTTSYQNDTTKTIPHITNPETTSYNLEEFKTFCCFQGPKVIARSIKKIKKGEEITVSYIDLLQPTGLRQSDLWSKYRFMCSCRRCAASPPAYVDSILEGVLTSVGHYHGNINKDEAMGEMTDHIQEAIDNFLSDDINPKSCCEKIENVLYHGIQIKADSQPNHHLWLHPIHHAALNGYITLATAYRIRSIDSETDMGKAFDMRRISAACSFFLACASHHLFSAEPSLAMSAAKFWTNAGESLLDFSRKFSSGRSDVKCNKCHMLETPNSLRGFNENSKKILSCVTDISQVVWSFLTRGCPCLQKFMSPFDFSFTKANGERDETSEDQTLSVLLLSFHCLLYADLLTDLCYGQNSHLLSGLHV